MPKLYLEQVTETAIKPVQATSHAACYDVCADLDEREIKYFDHLNEDGDLMYISNKKHTLQPGERVLVPTGWKMCCDPGWKIEIAPRSGNAIKKGLTLINCTGIIDADYRHEVMALMINDSTFDVEIKHGDRIAQLSLEKVNKIEMVVGVLPEIKSNRTGGMGSTDEQTGENK